MGAGFNLVYIIIALAGAGVIGLVIGPIWILTTSKESVQNRIRAGVIWLFLLAGLGVGFISHNSPEMLVSEYDTEDLTVTELPGRKLRVTARMVGEMRGVSGVEVFTYQSQSGFTEMLLQVSAKAADGRRAEEIDYTIDLPEEVVRVFFGDGSHLLWGPPEEESLAEWEKEYDDLKRRQEAVEDKLYNTHFVALWKDNDDMEEGEEVIGQWRADEIRRVYLDVGEETDGSLWPEREIVGAEDEFYMNRITGKIKAVKASYADGTFMIIDCSPVREDRVVHPDGSWTTSYTEEIPEGNKEINVIFGKEGEAIVLRGFTRSTMDSLSGEQAIHP